MNTSKSRCHNTGRSTANQPAIKESSRHRVQHSSLQPCMCRALVKLRPLLSGSRNLYDISDRVIKRLYDGNLGCRTPVSADMVPDLFAIEQDLSHWSMQLPEELTLIQSNDTAMLSESSDPSRLRFRVVLTLRYLNVELLLQRPFLVRSLGMQSPDTQSRQMSRSLENLGAGAIQASVKAAQESISIVHKILAHGPVGRQMLGAWWFTLFYSKCKTWLMYTSS